MVYTEEVGAHKTRPPAQQRERPIYDPPTHRRSNFVSDLSATMIAQPTASHQPQQVQFTRADLYRHLPAMRRAAQALGEAGKREYNALLNASRVLESCVWYMPNPDALIIKSEEEQRQYKVTTTGGCCCPAGRPCLIPGRRSRACAACVAYAAGDESAPACAIGKPCKHRGAFELCRRALAERTAAAAVPAVPAAPAKTFTDREYAGILADCDDLC